MLKCYKSNGRLGVSDTFSYRYQTYKPTNYRSRHYVHEFTMKTLGMTKTMKVSTPSLNVNL